MNDLTLPKAPNYIHHLYLFFLSKMWEICYCQNIRVPYLYI